MNVPANGRHERKHQKMRMHKTQIERAKAVAARHDSVTMNQTELRNLLSLGMTHAATVTAKIGEETRLIRMYFNHVPTEREARERLSGPMGKAATQYGVEFVSFTTEAL